MWPRQQRQGHTYEEKTDNYTTYLSTGALTVSGAKHRQIISDWSNGMSTGQLCHTHGIAESYFKQYKRIHKITRSAIPVTGEQLMEVDDQDGLIDEIIISRRHTLAADLAKEQHKRMSEDSKNWRTLMDDYVAHMTTLSKAPKSVPKIKLTKPKTHTLSLYVLLIFIGANMDGPMKSVKPITLMRHVSDWWKKPKHSCPVSQLSPKNICRCRFRLVPCR